MILKRPALLFLTFWGAVLSFSSGAQPPGSRPVAPAEEDLLWQTEGPPSPRARPSNYIGSFVGEGLEIERYGIANQTAPRDYFYTIRGWHSSNTLALKAWCRQPRHFSSVVIHGAYIDLDAALFERRISTLCVTFTGPPQVVNVLPPQESPASLRWLIFHYNLAHGDDLKTRHTIERTLLTLLYYRMSPLSICSVGLVLQGGASPLSYQYDPAASYIEGGHHDRWSWDAVFDMIRDALHPDSPKHREALAALFTRIEVLNGEARGPFFPASSNAAEDSEDDDSSTSSGSTSTSIHAASSGNADMIDSDDGEEGESLVPGDRDLLEPPE